MDSSKQEDGKERKSGNKRLRTNLHDSSCQVATSSASTDQANLGGSSETQESLFPLNILPPEIIDLIADKLSIMDCLNTQKAFARDPKEAVNNIRTGIAANLTKHRALYLLMDTDEYDVKYQYNYQMESELPNALLPTLEGLPIASEAFNMITLPELEKISISRLKRTFPNVVELKVVLRDCSCLWLTKLVKVVTVFSRKLTALQLLIFSDSPGRPTWKNNDLLSLLSFLNDAHFARLQHFTLLFEDTEENLGIFSCLNNFMSNNMKLLRLLSSERLEECYLRLPSHVIEPQLKLLRENQGLQRLGIIASSLGCFGFQLVNHLETTALISLRKILISSSLAAKTVHLLFPLGYRSRKIVSFSGWQIVLIQLDEYTSLQTLRISLNTNEEYLRLMNKLRRLGSLTHLQISLRYVSVSELTCRPLSQLAPCSPSVTHLKIQVVNIYQRNPGGETEGRRLQFSHLIFTHLSILRHFPNLQQLEVVFQREYSCSLCEITPADDGRDKQEDGKERKSGNKRLRTNLHDSSCQVATSSASTDQGGSNEAQELHSIPLNILKLDEIDLIAERLSIMDRLHFQQAFTNDPEEVVNNIRNGIAANLDKQRALYLLMDTDEYDVKYQYNYQMESELPIALLPTLEKLPIASEAFNMITLPELEKISRRRLKETFPILVELKVVLREWSPNWLTKLAKVVASFSSQLTALQLLIFADSSVRHRTIGNIGRKNEELLTSSSLAGKIVHQVVSSGYRSRFIADTLFGWQIDLSRLEQFTSLRTLRICLDTNGTYLTLMRKLSSLGSLTHLKICLGYLPRVICHEIYIHLSILRHFPNLQQLEVIVFRSFICSDCKLCDGHECLEMAMRPFRALD
ncbi:hypothetical protein TYRP_007055 [Tyrophagus putrescentiae]|nr:hypothetical protein TYRP_007055 [Tyrophagus putrescentiae]